MKKNSLLFGCIVGVFPPLIAHLLTLFMPWNISAKSLGFYVIAALINLLFVRFFYRNTCERSAQGVILITFAAALLLIFTEKLSLA